MSEELDIQKLTQEIAQNHRQILDDWCKAYLAELYESGITELYPSMFTLCETELHEEGRKLVKSYYIRKKWPCEEE